MAAQLGARRARFRDRALPMVVLRRPCEPRRRHDSGRPDRRRNPDRPPVLSRLARPRACSGDRGRLVPPLRTGRPVFAGPLRSSRLRDRADRGADVVRYGGDLRNPDLRVGELHLPVHPLRLLPGAGGHDRPVHRHRHGPVRERPRRPGQGRGVLVGPDGYDLGVGRRQRRVDGPVHHPPDEAFRLPVGLRGRRGGDRLHGRTDHAARHGRGGLHHGRDDRRPLRRDRQGRAHSGAPVLCLRVPGRPPRSRSRRSPRAASLRTSQPHCGTSAALVPDPASRGARLPALRGATRRSSRARSVWR